MGYYLGKKGKKQMHSKNYDSINSDIKQSTITGFRFPEHLANLFCRPTPVISLTSQKTVFFKLNFLDPTLGSVFT